jgi:hypothetical protein
MKPSTGIRSDQLTKFCSKILKNNFLGVFPCDFYPLKFHMINKTSVIFNLSTSKEKGSHFVAIYKNNKKILYFDSFGKKKSNKHIKLFFKSSQCQISYNLTCIQDIKSYFCGIYCLAFLIFCQKENGTLKSFINMFNKKNLSLNDTIVTRYVLKEIKKLK